VKMSFRGTSFCSLSIIVLTSTGSMIISVDVLGHSLCLRMYVCASYSRRGIFRYLQRLRISVVGIASSYGLKERGVGVRVPVVSRIFSSPRRRDRLGGSPNLLFNAYRGLFLLG
jgi:hypothetical protein